MSKGDITVIGISGGARPYRVAASETRGYAGEPIGCLATYSSGVATTDYVVVLSDAKPVIGTDNFVGVAAENMKVNSAGTVLAHTLSVVVPIPNCTRLQGRGKTFANVDTDAEILALLNNYVLFDRTSGVYTIDDTAAADTSGLQIVDGNYVKGTLDVIVDARAMRADIT